MSRRIKEFDEQEINELETVLERLAILQMEESEKRAEINNLMKRPDMEQAAPDEFILLLSVLRSEITKLEEKNEELDYRLACIRKKLGEKGDMVHV